MIRSIQPGDLVYVYRDCCGSYVGKHFRVHTIEYVPRAMCGLCPAQNIIGYMAFPTGSECKSVRFWFVLVEWLRRVPPLEELEDKREQEPIREKEIVR